MEKIFEMKKNVEAMKEARAFIDEKISSGRLNLNVWDIDDEECGSICCGMGWLAKMNMFGLRTNIHGFPQSADGNMGSMAAADVFGSGTYYEVFTAYGEGEWDDELLPKPKAVSFPVTHKTLLLARMDRFIAKYGAQS